MKQCKNKLKKEKSGYMTLISVCGTPEGATNSGNTSNDSHNISLKKSVLSEFHEVCLCAF